MTRNERNSMKNTQNIDNIRNLATDHIHVFLSNTILSYTNPQ